LSVFFSRDALSLQGSEDAHVRDRVSLLGHEVGELLEGGIRMLFQAVKEHLEGRADELGRHTLSVKGGR
jgi:hypothetical protein